MPVSHTISKGGVLTVPASDRRNYMRESAAAVGKADHRIRKPSKFTRAAKAKYGHADRNPRYIKRKLSHGGGLDFVYTGESRALLMGSNKINATAVSSSKGRVDVIFNAPVFNFAKLGGGLSVVDDFKKSNAAEVKRFYRLGFELWSRRLASHGRTTRKTTNG
jgi:hypothetical protein